MNNIRLLDHADQILLDLKNKIILKELIICTNPFFVLTLNVKAKY